ncbi:MAG: hypothetical protein AB7S48_01030 [Bacteroidales bacterium]
MSKGKIIQIIGLISCALIIGVFLIRTCSFFIDNFRIPLIDLMNNYLSIFIVFIFLSLRHILVTTLKLDHFKLTINLIIILQLIVLSLLIYMRFDGNLERMKIISIPWGISAFFILLLNFWFIILIFRIKRKEITGLIFLKFYALFVILITITRIVLSLILINSHIKYPSFSNFIEIVLVIPYLLLCVFLFVNYKRMSMDKVTIETEDK